MASSLSSGANPTSINLVGVSPNLSHGRGERGEESEQLLLGESSQQSAIDPVLLRRMYVGHFLSRWGARMWEFSVGLYMINIWPDSLLFTAIYGVVEAASTALFGPAVGTLVEKVPHKQVLRMWLLIRSLSFLVAGGAVTALLVYFGPSSHKFVPFMGLVVITNISGAISVLSTLAGTILIEREWVVVISHGRPPEVLAEMNSTVRRIDLICKLFAPVLMGFIISFVSLVASAVILALWNVLSVWLEYWLWITVYYGFPALSESRQRRNVEEVSSFSIEASIVESNSWRKKMAESLSKMLCFDAWIVYFKQDVVLPGVALALLYFTVLRKMSSRRLIFSFRNGIKLALDEEKVAQGAIIDFDLDFDQVKMDYEGHLLKVVDSEEAADLKTVLSFKTKESTAMMKKRKFEGTEEAMNVAQMRSMVLTTEGNLIGASLQEAPAGASQKIPLSRTQRRNLRRRKLKMASEAASAGSPVTREKEQVQDQPVGDVIPQPSTERIKTKKVAKSALPEHALTKLHEEHIIVPVRQSHENQREIVPYVQQLGIPKQLQIISEEELKKTSKGSKGNF